MEQEAREILQMVREGTITPEQGGELLEALKAAPSGAAALAGKKPRFIRVRVNVAKSDSAGAVVVNANLPIALADLALKMAQSAKITQGDQTIMMGEYLKDMGGVDISAIMQMVKEGAEGKLADVNVSGDKGEKVSVEVVVD